MKKGNWDKCNELDHVGIVQSRDLIFLDSVMRLSLCYIFVFIELENAY